MVHDLTLAAEGDSVRTECVVRTRAKFSRRGEADRRELPGVDADPHLCFTSFSVDTSTNLIATSALVSLLRARTT